MRITLEHEGVTTTITDPDAVTATQLVELYVRLGVACGWAESNIVDAMGTVAYLRDDDPNEQNHQG